MSDTLKGMSKIEKLKKEMDSGGSLVSDELLDDLMKLGDLMKRVRELYMRPFPVIPKDTEPGSFTGLRAILETPSTSVTYTWDEDKEPKPKAKRAVKPKSDPIDRPHDPDSIYGRALAKYKKT